MLTNFATWDSLGGGPNLEGNVAVGLDAHNRIEVFARGVDGALWHNQQTTPNGGWVGWVSLGAIANGGLSSNPIVARNADGRLEVFAQMGTQSELAHIWQTNNGSWSDWSALGNSSITDGDPITVGSNSDGRLEVFSGRWHIWQTAANNGWANWHSLAGPAGYSGFAPVMALNNDGRLEVFTRGADGALWHIWQNWSSPTGWSDWNSLHGAITSDPAVGLNGDGRLEVFARGTDSTLWHIWQTHPHAGPWSGWASLKSETDGNYPSAAAALNTNGKLEVFARGTDGAVWHTWQTLPHAGPWNDPWESLGGNLGGIVAFPNYGNHRLELFGMNGYTVMHTWKDTLTGNWH